MMKTAVCFTGICRSLEYTHRNIKEKLLDVIGEHDVFVHISENDNSHKAEKYLKDYNIKKILVEKETPIPLDEFTFEKAWHPVGPEIYLQMLFSMRRCNDMMLEYEKNNGFEYDRIIRSRLDVTYFESVEQINDYDLSYLYLPDFHCWHEVQGAGYNDRFAVGNRRDMNIYLTEYDSLKKYAKEGKILHAESTLRYHLEKNNVKVKLCPVRFTRVRGDGFREDLHIQKDMSYWPVEQTCCDVYHLDGVI